jgi:hypothetical protein
MQEGIIIVKQDAAAAHLVVAVLSECGADAGGVVVAAVLLEQQVEAARHRKQALEHGAALQVVRVAAPAVKDVMVCEATAAAAAGMSAV